MPKTLNEEQLRRSRRRWLYPVQLVRLRRYSNRDAGTVSSTWWIASAYCTYDYANTGTQQRFEPLLDAVGAITLSVNHLADDLVGHPELSIALRNIPFLSYSSFGAAVEANPVDNAEVELSEILLNWNESPRSLSAYVGDEHTVLFRGTVIAVNATDANSMTLVLRDIAARFDERTIWYGARDAEQPDTGRNPQQRDRGTRWPVIFGSPASWRPRVIGYPPVGTLRVEIAAVTTGAVAFEADTRSWQTGPNVIVEKEVLDISAISDTSLTIAARNQAGSSGGAVAHDAGREVLGILPLIFIVADHVCDLLGMDVLINLVERKRQGISTTATVVATLSDTEQGRACATLEVAAAQVDEAYVPTGGEEWDHEGWYLIGRRGTAVLARGAEAPDASYAVASGVVLKKAADCIRYLLQTRLPSFPSSQIAPSIDETGWAVAEANDDSAVDLDARWIGFSVTEICKRLAVEALGVFFWDAGQAKLVIPDYLLVSWTPDVAALDFTDSLLPGFGEAIWGVGDAMPYGDTPARAYLPIYDDSLVKLVNMITNADASENISPPTTTGVPGLRAPHILRVSANGTYLMIACRRWPGGGAPDPGERRSHFHRYDTATRTLQNHYDYGNVEDNSWGTDICNVPGTDQFYNIRNPATVEHISAAGGQTSATPAPGGTAPGLTGATADASNVWVLDAARDSVWRYANPVSTQTELALDGAATPRWCCNDTSNVYIVDIGNNTVSKYTKSPWAKVATLSIVQDGYRPEIFQGKLYVPTLGGLYRIDPASFKIEEFDPQQVGTTFGVNQDTGGSLPKAIGFRPETGAAELFGLGVSAFTISWGAALRTFDAANTRGITGDRKDLGDLVTRLSVLYRFDPSAGRGDAIGDEAAFAGRRDLENVAASALYGTREREAPYVMATTCDDVQAHTYAQFLRAELSALRWVFRWEADWVDAYDLLPCDVVNVHPAWLAAPVKTRLLSVSRDPDSQVFSFEGVQIVDT